ncbi:MAG TPA: hypothetical protein VGC91_09935 [Pyrinomonadaceae bacterium]
MKRLLAAFVLACALTVSAYAGDIYCGRTTELEDVGTSLTGEISCGVTQTVATLIMSLL